MAIQAYLYNEKNNQESKELAERVNTWWHGFDYELNIINIESEKYLKEKYTGKTPFIVIGPYQITAPFEKKEMLFAIEDTQRRLETAVKREDNRLIESYTQLPKINRSDKRALWFSRHFMFLFNLLVVIYVGLPFLAPIFMKLDIPRPAQVIYKIYRPLCHQLAFRSWFLFGDQIAYPRELANIESLRSYGEVTGNDEFDLITASKFIGDEQSGYKIALCQRDIAIYLAIFLFGIVYSNSKRFVPSIPWYVWIILGVLPIAIDGVSQLLSQTGLSLFSWLPLRESTPFLRSLTGGLFGLFTAWYGYPYINESVEDNRKELEHKMAIIKQIGE